MNNNSIIAVSAGMKEPKKSYNKLNTRNLYLNYGLLGLSTKLYNKGYSVCMFQGDFDEPEITIEKIESKIENLNNLKYPLLLSIPSNFAIPWAKEFSRLLKVKYPNIKIVAGGRWVIYKGSNWINNIIPELDFAVPGLGDDIIEDMLDPNNWSSLVNNDRPCEIKSFDLLNYELLDNFKKYYPCIEVSRGCGRGCAFCMEKDIPLSRLKSPSDIIKEMKRYIKLYEKEDIYIYFESSLFAPTLKWARELKELYEKENLKVKWRCTSRIDTFTPELIDTLSKAGMKVIDLGLESASKEQLLRMNKTKKPDEYLKKAEALLKSSYKNNVWVKLNILLFPGESYKTLEETKGWLLNHKKYIKGISANPMTLYGENATDEAFKSFGASLVDYTEANRLGYSRMNLSSEISYDDSIRESNIMCRLIMTKEDYFDLKKMCYFSTYYTYDEFLNDLKELDEENLTFIL